MRATLLLAGVLALLAGACSDKGGKGGHASPPLNKQLLAGKWKNVSDVLLITGFEFGADGTVKMTVQGMKQPVAGRYTWSGERTLDLEYQAADVQQAYQAAAKAYKDDLKEQAKKGKLYDRAVTSMSAAVRDQLPAGEKFQVALPEGERLLILVNESGATQNFEPAD